MFSHFLDDFVGVPNVFSLARAELRRQGKHVIDLASGSVQDIDILFPEDILARAHARALVQAKRYTPHSKGQPVLRQAIAEYYSVPDFEHIVVTPGTSQSYWYLFSLLSNPGDEILVPRPIYPLFDYIAKLSHVTLAYYDLKVGDESEVRDGSKRVAGGRWGIDIEGMRRSITSRTKAIVLISPHNPTGHVLTQEESMAIARLACEYKLPLIIDEVFYEFIFDDSLLSSSSTRVLPQREAFRDCPLVFTLNGFSKMFALPGLKIGWIFASGHPVYLTPALAALETVADTFLSTNEVAQFVAADIFQSGRSFLRDYKKELRIRWEASKSYYSIIPLGGFYGVKYFHDSDRDVDEDAYVLDLLQSHHVLVHPGYFYSLDRPGIVFSFLRHIPEFTFIAPL